MTIEYHRDDINLRRVTGMTNVVTWMTSRVTGMTNEVTGMTDDG